MKVAFLDRDGVINKEVIIYIKLKILNLPKTVSVA
ncbi:Uncharacterised protein [Escherichia coli]|nr:Uncharacterised protein [Escherichia coli]